MSKIKLSKDFIRNTVKLALNEDLYPSGDITSNLVNNNKIIKFKLLSNQEAVVGGLLFVQHAFNLVDPKIRFSIIDLKLAEKNFLILSFFYYIFFSTLFLLFYLFSQFVSKDLKFFLELQKTHFSI